MSDSAKYNLSWRAGNTEEHVLRYKDSNGTPIPLIEGDLHIRAVATDEVAILKKDGVVANNQVSFLFSKEETLALTPTNTKKHYVYETLVTTVSGDTKTLTLGRLLVEPTTVRGIV